MVKVVFNTVGGRKINAQMDLRNHIEVTEFVDNNDYIFVDTLPGITECIPKDKIDSYEVNVIC